MPTCRSIQSTFSAVLVLFPNSQVPTARLFRKSSQGMDENPFKMFLNQLREYRRAEIWDECGRRIGIRRQQVTGQTFKTVRLRRTGSSSCARQSRPSQLISGGVTMC